MKTDTFILKHLPPTAKSTILSDDRSEAANAFLKATYTLHGAIKKHVWRDIHFEKITKSFGALKETHADKAHGIASVFLISRAKLYGRQGIWTLEESLGLFQTAFPDNNFEPILKIVEKYDIENKLIFLKWLVGSKEALANKERLIPLLLKPVNGLKEIALEWLVKNCDKNNLSVLLKSENQRNIEFACHIIEATKTDLSSELAELLTRTKKGKKIIQRTIDTLVLENLHTQNASSSDYNLAAESFVKDKNMVGVVPTLLAFENGDPASECIATFIMGRCFLLNPQRHETSVLRLIRKLDKTSQDKIVDVLAETNNSKAIFARSILDVNFAQELSKTLATEKNPFRKRYFEKAITKGSGGFSFLYTFHLAFKGNTYNIRERNLNILAAKSFDLSELFQTPLTPTTTPMINCFLEQLMITQYVLDEVELGLLLNGVWSEISTNLNYTQGINTRGFGFEQTLDTGAPFVITHPANLDEREIKTLRKTLKEKGIKQAFPQIDRKPAKTIFTAPMTLGNAKLFFQRARKNGLVHSSEFDSNFSIFLLKRYGFNHELYVEHSGWFIGGKIGYIGKSEPHDIYKTFVKESDAFMHAPWAASFYKGRGAFNQPIKISDTSKIINYEVNRDLEFLFKKIPMLELSFTPF